ncbi:DUF6316 family protein [Pseudomonas sp. R5(2019)]|uniref:DUF6316 family protein n=1 Tax=Pseudomonas sp. R5(2019) TaxID=2697566 RepID=UPI003531EF6E
MACSTCLSWIGRTPHSTAVNRANEKPKAQRPDEICIPASITLWQGEAAVYCPGGCTHRHSYGADPGEIVWLSLIGQTHGAEKSYYAREHRPSVEIAMYGKRAQDPRPTTHFRSDRISLINGLFYFSTRETPLRGRS